MTLLKAVDVLRHAMPNLKAEQQQSMMQDIAAYVNNIRNGMDKQTLASERWQKVSSCPDHLASLTKKGNAARFCTIVTGDVHFACCRS